LRHKTDHELIDLAARIADWCEPVSQLRRLVLFGSRVRGDHRPDSDVDIWFDYKNDLEVTNGTVAWWIEKQESEFASLKRILPGSLALHIDYDPLIWPLILVAAQEPFYRDRKCVCVWLPPKPPGAPAGRPFGPPRPNRDASSR
jgi:predicted nucleotidyltransferase